MIYRREAHWVSRLKRPVSVIFGFLAVFCVQGVNAGLFRNIT